MNWPELALGLLLLILAAGSLDGARRDRHRRRCPACRAAVAHVAASHPEWLNLWSEHRAAEPSRDVVAVFYFSPDEFEGPSTYLIVAVNRATGRASELPGNLGAPYHIRGVK